MNILIVPPNDIINYDTPNRLYHLACRWQKRHTIYLLRYPHYPMSLSSERPLNYIPIIPNAKPAKNLGAYQLRNAKTILASIEQALKKEPIDIIVHANILPSSFAIYSSKKFRIKNVYDYLDHFPSSAATYYKNTLTKKFVYITTSIITAYNLKNSDLIVTVGYGQKQMIEKYTSKPIYIIPNGVDTQIFRPIEKYKARKILELEHYDSIITYFGSITEWIDYNALLYITARLKQKFKKLLLFLIGRIYKDNERIEILQKIKYLKIEENVNIIPMQPQDKMPIYIAASDVIIAPYKILPKNFVTPLKIFETLACERPIVLPNISEFKYWAREFAKYYRTINELENVVSSILKDPSCFNNLKEARAYIEENFDWSKLAIKYEKVAFG